MDPKSLDVLNQFDEARALKGAAVKLALAYGIDLDDVAQELAINALLVKEELTFEHVNTIVWRTRGELGSERYGVNRYYHRKGVAEVGLAEGDDAEDLTEWNVAFADETFDWGSVDTALAVRKTVSELPELERGIALGLMEGLSGREIAAKLGCHEVTVSRKKNELRGAFAWAQ